MRLCQRLEDQCLRAENMCIQMNKILFKKREKKAFKVISGRIPTCKGMVWQLVSTAHMGDGIAGAMTHYATQLHYSDTAQSSPCPTLLIPSARLDNNFE